MRLLKLVVRLFLAPWALLGVLALIDLGCAAMALVFLGYVPLTLRLAAALREHRHLRGARVVCQRDGSPLTQKIVQDHVRRAVRRAQLAKSGVHRLRHTFCSHLAMRGAPARAIQELAGHMDLATTQRYMHLSPAAIESAIRLLDRAPSRENFGDIMETGSIEIANSSR